MQPRIVLVSLLWTVSAGAEPVYKCEEKGAITYTDQPCSGAAREQVLPPLVVMEAPGPARQALARQYDARVAQDRAERDRADTEWLKQHRNRRDREERVRKAIIGHTVIKSMTMDEVKRALGEPDHVDTGDSYGTAKETWTYVQDGQRRTVNFKNGEVISTQRKGRRQR
jgi:hypothetical protein